jgi:Mg2+ and Co2+ transporter CorA
MIASFYGMNVDLPLSEHALAFPFTLGLSLVAAVVVGWIFWKKDWL